MKPTPFNLQEDLPPIPFDERHRLLAQSLKEAGLPWKPHVGCFVRDPNARIDVGSPFPGRVYFVLNLGHFLKIFGTLYSMKEGLVWLPTWHQARLLCSEAGLEEGDVAAIWKEAPPSSPGDEVLALYELLLRHLKDK
jgi:hypothetical protein